MAMLPYKRRITPAPIFQDSKVFWNLSNKGSQQEWFWDLKDEAKWNIIIVAKQSG